MQGWPAAHQLSNAGTAASEAIPCARRSHLLHKAIGVRCVIEGVEGAAARVVLVARQEHAHWLQRADAHVPARHQGQQHAFRRAVPVAIRPCRLDATAVAAVWQMRQAPTNTAHAQHPFTPATPHVSGTQQALLGRGLCLGAFLSISTSTPKNSAALSSTVHITVSPQHLAQPASTWRTRARP